MNGNKKLKNNDLQRDSFEKVEHTGFDPELKITAGKSRFTKSVSNFTHDNGK